MRLLYTQKLSRQQVCCIQKVYRYKRVARVNHRKMLNLLQICLNPAKQKNFDSVSIQFDYNNLVSAEKFFDDGILLLSESFIALNLSRGLIRVDGYKYIYYMRYDRVPKEANESNIFGEILLVEMQINRKICFFITSSIIAYIRTFICLQKVRLSNCRIFQQHNEGISYFMMIYTNMKLKNQSFFEFKSLQQINKQNSRSMKRRVLTSSNGIEDDIPQLYGRCPPHAILYLNTIKEEYSDDMKIFSRNRKSKLFQQIPFKNPIKFNKIIFIMDEPIFRVFLHLSIMLQMAMLLLRCIYAINRIWNL